MSRSLIQSFVRFTLTTALSISSLVMLPMPANAAQGSWQSTVSLTPGTTTSRDAVLSSTGGNYFAWTAGTEVRLAYRAANQAFGNSVLVHTGSSPNGLALEALSNGGVAIAWLDGDSSTHSVYFATANGTTVSSTSAISSLAYSMADQGGVIDMDANSSNDLALSYVAYQSSGNRRSFATRYDAASSTWESLAQISTNEIYTNGSWVVMREDGSAVNYYTAVNTSTWTGELRSSVNSSGTWSAPSLFSLSGGSGNESGPVVGADGSIHVVWDAYTSPRKIGYASMAPGTTTFSSELLTVTGGGQLGELAVAPDGEVSIAYVANSNTASIITKPAGGSWGTGAAAAASNTATAAESYSRINAEYTATNRLIVTWTGAYNGSGRTIYAVVRSAAGVYGSAQALSATNSQFDMNSVVVTGADDTATVHWIDAPGPVHTATLQAGSDTFEAQTNLGSINGGRQAQARFAAFQDASGDASLFWEDSAGGVSFATTDAAAAPPVVQGVWQSVVDAAAATASVGGYALDAADGQYIGWTSDNGPVTYSYRANGTSFAATRTMSGTNAKSVEFITDSAGVVHAFWLDGFANETHIYTATATNGGFGARTSIGSVTADIASQMYPQEQITIAAGSGGRLLVTAIINNSSGRIGVAVDYNGSAWGPLTVISGSDIYVNSVQGAFRADGTPFVQYVAYNPSSSNQEGHFAILENGTWGTRAAFTGSSHIAGSTKLIALANGDIVFGYTGISGGIRKTYGAVITNGATTVTATDLGRADHLLSPEITVLSTGEVVMAFIGRDPASQGASTLYLNTVSRDVSGNWGTPAIITSTDAVTQGENFSRFAIASTSNDTVVAAWVTPWSGSGFGIKAAIKPDGGIFGSAQDLGYGTNPSILVNPLTTVATVYWKDSSGTLFAATVNEGATTLTAPQDFGTTTSVFGGSLTSAGDAHLVVTQSGSFKHYSTQTSSVPQVVNHTVTINFTGSGAGTVDNTANVNYCSTDCTFTVLDGTVVGFAAYPADEATSEFTGWSGACSGTADCEIMITADITITANFESIEAPANTALPTITGDAIEEETLTATLGSWTGAPAPNISIIWQRSTDGPMWTNITGTSGATTYTLTSGDVGRLIRVKVTGSNAGGNVFAYSQATDEVMALEVDQCQAAVTPPAGQVGVSINTGALYTTSRTVTLKMVWDDCRTHALISNDGGFANATRIALPVNGTTTWTLPNTGSDRLPKTVYIKFESPDSTYSQTITDDIILDMTAPAVTSIAKQSLSKKNYTTKIKATDTSSGVYSVYFYDKNKKVLKAITYRNATTTITIGTKKAVYIRLKDRAGNYTKYLSIK